MTKQKFYAVRAGIRPGIYHTWADCEKQTNGVPGAVFKSFSTQEDADNFLGGKISVRHPTKASKKRNLTTSDTACSSSEALIEENNPASASLHPSHRPAAQTASKKQLGREEHLPEVASWLEPNLTYRLVRHCYTFGTDAVSASPLSQCET